MVWGFSGGLLMVYWACTGGLLVYWGFTGGLLVVCWGFTGGLWVYGGFGGLLGGGFTGLRVVTGGFVYLQFYVGLLVRPQTC